MVHIRDHIQKENNELIESGNKSVVPEAAKQSQITKELSWQK